MLSISIVLCWLSIKLHERCHSILRPEWILTLSLRWTRWQIILLTVYRVSIRGRNSSTWIPTSLVIFLAVLWSWFACTRISKLLKPRSRKLLGHLAHTALRNLRYLRSIIITLVLHTNISHVLPSHSLMCRILVSILSQLLKNIAWLTWISLRAVGRMHLLRRSILAETYLLFWFQILLWGFNSALGYLIRISLWRWEFIFKVFLEDYVIIILGNIIFKTVVFWQKANQFFRRTVVSHFSRLYIFTSDHILKDNLTITSTLDAFMHVKI
jgi:hypothetical protein